MTVVEKDGVLYEREIKPFGELKPGELLESPSGLVEVDEVFETHIPKKMFELETEAGAKLELSGNHLLYVESSLDLASHRLRCRNGKRWAKTLSSESIAWLEEWAFSSGETEIMLADLGDELNAAPNSPAAAILARVAMSIGPVSEYNYNFRNVDTRPIVSIPAYDLKSAAQQVLSFFKSSKYPWKTIVGQVVKVEDIVNSQCEFWIPDVSG